MAKRAAGVMRQGSSARRRRVNSDPFRKTGWQVRQSVADAVKQVVESGAAESQNAFVERALIRELKEVRRKRVYEAYAEAASDPAFMEDMRATTAAFDAAAGDGLRDRQG